MSRLLSVSVLCFASLTLAADPKGKPGKFSAMALEKRPLYATITTSAGEIVVELFSAETPNTVANFVGLAMGEKEFVDPLTQKKAKRPYYKNVSFHRVIEGFMIQGGDPTGTGAGGPGYKFEDEVGSGRTFSKVGLLAMANAGPATNGSQFFITTSTPEYLNGKHTIFGQVLSGYDIVEKISKVPKDPRDRPVTPVLMKSVSISDAAPKGVAK
jgi:peptidyl-prolyl cis-trans isomerase A (cyclophilin A)